MPRVFVSYAREDIRWVREGETEQQRSRELIPRFRSRLKGEGVEIWPDPKLWKRPSDEYLRIIRHEIDRADLAILLISEDFVASDFILKEELPRIRARVEKREIAMIIILVGHLSERGKERIEWVFARPVLPSGSTPLIQYLDADDEWDKACVQLTDAIWNVFRAKRCEAPISAWAGTPLHAPACGLTAGEVQSVYLGGDVMLELAWCPPGTFMMWSPENEEGRHPNEVQLQVTLAQGFWMGKYEVTQGQWQAVMGNNPSHHRGDLRLPVEMITWYDCQKFINKLNTQIGGGRFSLPTEAEWEYACRAGTTTPFHFGETISPDLANYNGNHRYANGPTGEYREKTTVVGSFPANPWGLHDMHGNVWEWCLERLWGGSGASHSRRCRGLSKRAWANVGRYGVVRGSGHHSGVVQRPTAAPLRTSGAANTGSESCGGRSVTHSGTVSRSPVAVCFSSGGWGRAASGSEESMPGSSRSLAQLADRETVSGATAFLCSALSVAPCEIDPLALAGLRSPLWPVSDLCCGRSPTEPLFRPVGLHWWLGRRPATTEIDAIGPRSIDDSPIKNGSYVAPISNGHQAILKKSTHIAS